MGFNPTDPASPGYNWNSIDGAVRDLSARGLRVLINITFAPTWAEGPGRPANARPGTWEPDPQQFGSFAVAAATRYSGNFHDPANPGTFLPRVGYWQGWNEPNLYFYLAPQWARTSTGFAPLSPGMYRALENAFYGAIKSVAGSNFVLLAGTSPYGDPDGGSRMRPLAFDRALFCLTSRLKPTSCPNPIHLDGVDHHPYNIKDPLHKAFAPDDATVPDMHKIARVTAAAEHSGRILPRGRKPLWATEISWDSSPPDPRGVPIATQARYLEQSLYVLWRQGVSTILWFQIRDAAPVPDYAHTYQAGIFYLSGQPKPSATAFRFPFVASRLDRSRLVVWGKAPSGGTLTIERLNSKGRWQRIKRIAVRRGQVFTTTLKVRGGIRLRARVGTNTSLSWNQAR